MSGWQERTDSSGYLYYTYGPDFPDGQGREPHVGAYYIAKEQVTGQCSAPDLCWCGKQDLAAVVDSPLKLTGLDLKPDAPGPHSKKAPMHALPLDRMGGLSRALDHGDVKYMVRNWVDTAKDPRLYIGAALRHLAAIMRGEMIDPDSGLPHVNHFQASAIILEEALRNSGQLTWEPSEP